ncbi:amino acid adenylation domain-containing protein [Actinomadura graeca]|uniref:Phenyloxazoline synthase MbtB n=1 Tax=Actinomadura graeca TaxID=2750812 RepID=A0ABX8QSR5_9ACTN|nr:non-ribosomal peptide synthetase [Actinomadura graeca]QXJ21808.1 amino acid adenylation domain-containing protein [Actinomadura graeca]
MPPDILPLSFAQSRLWFLEQLFPGRATYHLPLFFTLHGVVDVDALRTALEVVAERHEALRSTFPDKEGEPRQLVHDRTVVDFTVADVAGDVDAHLLRLVARPFDLAAGPLWRVRLLRTGPRDHVLASVFHHLISDGWSMGIYTRELGHHYDRAVRGGGGVLAEPEIQFGDFVLWEREHLSDDRLARGLRFWKEQLNGAPDLLALPTDRPRPPVASNAGRLYGTRLPRELTRDVRRLGEREGVTPFMVLLAGYSVLLNRYAQSSDLMVGVPTAGRSQPETEGVFGYFANTVPLRLQVHRRQDFREVLQQVRQVAVDAYDHQDIPLDVIVDELGAARDLSRNPLIQTLFVLLEKGRSTLGAGHSGLELHGVTTSARRPVTGHAKFDLSLVAEETEQGYALEFEYATDLFAEETVQRMAESYARLLASAVAAPDRPVGEHVLEAPAEVAERVRALDGANLPHDQDILLHQYVERFARRTPDAPAIREERGELTYRELNERANRLARALAVRGVGSGIVVGIALPAGSELITAMVAVLKTGGAHVALDVDHPRARIRAVLADADASLVITCPALRDAVAGIADAVVPADPVERQDIDRFEPTDLAVPVRADEMAYLVYTSGSTGEPKGVPITHRNVTRLFPAPDPLYRFGPDDCWTLFHSCAFDLSVWEIWGALSHGAALSPVPVTVSRSPEEFAEYLVRHEVSVLNQTPAAYEQLLSHFVLRGVPEALCLHTVILGGEAWGAELAERHRALLGRTALYNEYGPAEAAVWTTHRRVYDPETKRLHPVDLGVPHSQSLVVVLDEDGRPALPGTVGELCLGGEGLTRGYWKRPELDAGAFFETVLPGGGTHRLYRTGDLGRYTADGRVEFVGRKDRQVKIRGYRIELREVESALLALPGVREALVTVADGLSLVAHVVPGLGADVTEASVAEGLRAKLPLYMVPSRMVLLDAFPLTANGKIDHDRLPAPRPVRRAVHVEPGTPTERTVTEVFAEILGIAPFSAEADFFDHGGHSLLATQAAAKIAGRTGLPCPVRALFECGTPVALARRLDDARAEAGMLPDPTGPVLPEVVADPDRRHEPFPLTDVQQAYWVGRTGALDFGEVSVHCYVEYDVPDLDVARLERAFNRLVLRHEALRLVVEEGRQRILPEVPVYRIEITDLEGHEPEAAERALATIRERMAHQVLPSECWPLFEIVASRLPNGHRLHLSLDALVLDAWSLNLILNEWALLYREETTELPVLELSVRDYVLAEQAVTETEAFRQSRDYWTARLDTLPSAPVLPLARTVSTGPYRFDRVELRLSAAELRALREGAERHGLSLSAVLAAAFGDTLATWSAEPHFTVTMTLFNRLPVHPQINQIAGDFTSVNLLELDLSEPDVPFSERAAQTQRRLWEDLDHRCFNGVRVLRELGRRRRLDGGPLMPVVFTCLLGGEGQACEWEDLFPDEVFNITQTPQVWLDYQVYESRGELVVCWDHLAGLFPDGLVHDMHAVYCAALRALADDEGAWRAVRLASLPPEQTRRRADVNETAWAQPGRLLHQLFEDQAAAAPDAVAVVAEDHTLSYRQLNIAANRVARRLTAAGVGPGDRVAVLVGKGWRQVAAVLAILKAGGAYLPLDSGAPQRRVELMLQQAEARGVLAAPDVLDRVTGLTEWCSPGAAAVLSMGEDLLERAAEDEDITDPAACRSLTDLAYVIFTSGSTGEPKGVMIDHRGVVNTVLDINDRFGVGPEDRVLALSALGFDLSVYDVFGPLAAGGAVVVPPDDQVREPALWARWLVDHRVTVWNTVPMLMEMFVEALNGRHDRIPDDLTNTLRLILLSGDWIPTDLPGRVSEVFGDPRVVSLGGATEASIWSILHEVDDVDPQWKSIPYGRPLRNQTFHVLDRDMRPRPDHVPGDLYIGGIGLAQGYWRDAERTNAAFVLHPHTGERLYRTGDLGRYLPSGDIEFLGRDDLQVKVGGHRIELGEIEHCLAQVPGLRQGLAHVFTPDGRTPRLVAYLHADVPDADDEAEAAAVEFRIGQHGLRVVDGICQPIEADPDVKALSSRKSFRVFTGAPVRRGLAAWLTEALAPRPARGAEWTINEAIRPLLACWTEESALPRRRYGSAGALYPVQTYLVSGKNTSDVPAGVFYLDPVKRQWGQVGAVEAAVAWRTARGGRGPALLLVAKGAAIEPQYGDRGLLYSAIEAGAMAELVMEATRSSWLLRQDHDPGGLASLVLEGPDCRLLGVLEPGTSSEEADGTLSGSLPTGVTVLVHVKPNDLRPDVAGALSAGWWRWEEGHWVGLDGPEPAPDLSNPDNWSIYQSASASVFVVDHTAGCCPVWAAGLPVGMLIQRLAETGARYGLGGCSIGDLDPTSDRIVRAAAGGGTVLHAFFAGPVADTQRADTRVSEAVPFRQVLSQRARAALERDLPSYMVPEHYVVLSRLPLSHNGKLDRSRLPAPAVAEGKSRTAVGDRRFDATEQILADLWAELLGVTPGPDDDFFALGGHSLTATLLLNRVREVFGVDLRLRGIFLNPDVLAQARLIETLRADVSDIDTDAALRRRYASRSPASSGQQRLWFAEQLVPSERRGSVYAMPSAVRIDGEMRWPELRRAVERIVNRHEVLRTTFQAADGRIWQVVHERMPVELEVEDCPGASEADRAAYADRRLRELAGCRFDLEHGPMFRFHALRLAEDRHLLFTALHHIVSDGWSVGVFAAELDIAYRAELEHREPELPELAVQYADYAAWQLERGTRENVTRRLAFWRRAMAEAPTMSVPPVDLPRPARQDFTGSSVSRMLSSEVARGIEEHCRGLGVTPFAFYLATYTAWLSHVTGQDEVVVGTPVDMRNHPYLERLIGFFANMLALRVRPAAGGTFADHVQAVRDQVLVAHEHREVPFENVVDGLGIDRDTSRHPLFQTTFVYENADRISTLPAAIPVPLESTAARYEVSVLLRPRDGRWELTIEYATGLFLPETAERWLNEILNLLDAVAADPQMPLSETATVLDRADDSDTGGLRGPRRPIPEITVSERFEEMVRLHPDECAISTPGATVGYRELNSRANRIARLLLADGAGRGRVVAVCMRRSVDLFATYLAVLKIGSCYSAIDGGNPSSRIAALLDDLAPDLVVTDRANADKIGHRGCRLVLDERTTADLDDGDLSVEVGPDDLAYIVYTSGSTGEPKGVRIRHRGVVNLALSQHDHFGVGPGRNVLSLASCGHDGSVWEWSTALLNGAALTVVADAAAEVVNRLHHPDRHPPVHVAALTPTVLAALPQHALPDVEVLLAAGESCPQSLIDDWSGRARMFNVYGPCEATVTTTVFPVDVHHVADTIGLPVRNTEVWLLDERLRPVPPGTAGEICVGGVGLAEGYHRLDEATTVSFVEAVVGGRPTRLYRTGDRGRRSADGLLEFLGRLDDQVKIRGIRVEPGEVRARLLELPGVDQAAVIFDTEAGEARLLGYLVAERPLDTGGLRDRLRRTLPDAMVPAWLCQVDELPRTLSGKVDAARLPRPQTVLDRNRPAQEPNPTERRLRTLMETVLEGRQLGLDDDFFRNGGHSLKAVQLVTAAYEEFGIELEVRDVFDQPTVARLARLIDDRGRR